MTNLDDPEKTILLTGGSGYAGSLIAAAIVTDARCRLVLPVRSQRDPAAVVEAIAREVRAVGHEFGGSLDQRISVLPVDDFSQLGAELDDLVPDEIIHCAGCLDYYDSAELQSVNVDLCNSMIDLGKQWQVDRFVYISTAYSSGLIDTPVPEALHSEPPSDPTDYTRTKRMAEGLVANSGLPFLILRPAILIGNSITGHYFGKAYGLYQLWSGIERLLCSQWQAEFHLVASRTTSCLVHQDAFQAATLAAMRDFSSDEILNIASPEGILPNGRALWSLWMDNVFLPQRIEYYEHPENVPLRSIPRKQRALLALASTNLEIAAHRWRFETSNLDRLISNGLDFRHVTLESVWRCQKVFIENSARVQALLATSRPSQAPSVSSQTDRLEVNAMV